MKDKHTTIRLSEDVKRLLELLKADMNRPNNTNVIEELIRQEAKRRKLK